MARRTPTARWTEEAARQVAGLATIVVIWEVARQTGLVSRDVLPAAPDVASRAVSAFRDGDLSRHLASSVDRVATGLAVGGLAGASIGVLTVAPVVGAPIRAATELLRPVPPIAWIPIAIAWQGIGYRSSVVVVVIGVVFPLALLIGDTARASIGAIEPTMRLYRLRRHDVVRLAFPAALPGIVTAVRLAVGLGWTSVVAAELISSDRGLGYLIQQSRLALDMEMVIVSMIMIGFVGVVLTGVASLAGRLALARWRPDLAVDARA